MSVFSTRQTIKKVVKWLNDCITLLAEKYSPFHSCFQCPVKYKHKLSLHRPLFCFSVNLLGVSDLGVGQVVAGMQSTEMQ